jgi:predicted Rossmann fold flavoprotein
LICWLTRLCRTWQKFDAIILGGGAAGLMCAIEAGRRGRKVVVLERADRIGKKILISGGGRCNFTNIHCTPENFLSSNPHFCKSALARYTPEDFLALVQKHRIPYHEKTLGQLFCDRSSLDIVNLLEDECRATQVRILVNAQVQRVDRDSVFVVTTNTDKFVSETLVVATSGFSFKMGATAFGYQIAKQFGLKLKTAGPLVPLTLTAADRRRYCDLLASQQVIASANGHKFREKMRSRTAI